MRRYLIALLGFAFALARSNALTLTEDFSTNPTGTWSFGIGDNSRTQIVWTGSALNVHYDSSRPTVRFQRPLGRTVTDTDDFKLTARFRFNSIHAPDDQFMQIAFGLVNSLLTGGDRTGSFADFYSDNTFHSVEFSYFPNYSTFFDTGPTLTPAVFGAQTATNADAFANFASIFGSGSDLRDNTNDVTSLPTNVTLQATLAYSGATKTLTLTVGLVDSNSVLDTGVPPLNLSASFYDTNFPFRCDALAIMAFQDGFTTTNDPSLIADVQYQRFEFILAEPPPVTINLTDSDVVLTFPTDSNVTYHVQSRTDLVMDSWSMLVTNIAGTGGVVTNIDTGAATLPAKFYRVGVTLQ